MKAEIHESAIVDNGAEIGCNTKIWHWTHVCSGAVIGRDCSLGQNVFIGNNVTIGDNVKIQNNVSIYDNVTLEDDVFCGPSMVFTNVFNPRSSVSRKNEYRNTLIKRGATLGANATIVCGHVIGEHAFIAAGSVVIKDINDFSLVVGVPSKHVGWMSRHGEKLNFSKNNSEIVVCPHTGDRYILDNDLCRLI